MPDTAITFRVPTPLRTAANQKANRLGLPLTVVLRNALNDFVRSNSITISDPEIVKIPKLQAKANRIGEKLAMAVKAKAEK